MKRILSLFMAMLILTTSFNAITVFADSFTDIDAGHWAYESVIRLVNDGTINGYEDGSFKPDGTVTRAEFVKMLGKSEVLREADFNDVTASHWAYDYVMYSGLEGDENNNFRPDEAILRGDVANLLYKRFANGTEVVAPYIISSQGTDTKATAWVYTYGLMVGDDMINLRLGDTLTRAEAAVLIVRAKNLDTSKQRNFIDNFSDEVYKKVYDASDIFDTEYDANAPISNGELALAALRFRFKSRTPKLGMYYYEKAYDGDYAAEWNIMCKYALPEKKYTSSEEESKKNATVAEGIAMLSFVAANDLYTKIALPEESIKTYAGVKNDDDSNYVKYMRAAYNTGISLYADGNINPDKEITKRELACILLQYDQIYGSHVMYRCGYNCTYEPAPMRINLSSYPANSDDYSIILEDVPNNIYETPFAMDYIYTDELASFATSIASVFLLPLTTAAEAMYNAGIDVYITYIPSLLARVVGGYAYRLKFEVKDTSVNANLSDIFTLNEGVEDIALTKGATFWVDLNTNAELSGLYIDINEMTVSQVIR